MGWKNHDLQNFRDLYCQVDIFVAHLNELFLRTRLVGGMSSIVNPVKLRLWPRFVQFPRGNGRAHNIISSLHDCSFTRKSENAFLHRMGLFITK